MGRGGGVCARAAMWVCVAVVTSGVAAMGQTAGSQAAGEAAGQAKPQPCPAPVAVPESNWSMMDADGTEHITRVGPVPTTLSPEAQAALKRDFTKTAPTGGATRAIQGQWQKAAGVKLMATFPVGMSDGVMGGVPVLDVRPPVGQEQHPDRVLVNLHGGGFHVDSGSQTETIPLASMMHTRVVAVLYRLAPEHPFPAAVDDAVAVYKELLKTYKPEHMVIYGTSAGAILTGEVAVRLKQLGLPLPAALGIFSGSGDYSQPGDSGAIFSLHGLNGCLPYPFDAHDPKEYFGSTPTTDPVLSPLYADLHGMPPTLFLSSERDMLLSSTTILHRAFLRAGVDARLVVFDGLPHAFWNNASLPESREAYGYMAAFFAEHMAP
jgi:monoterpene epsilon-lactone hydrolase